MDTFVAINPRAGNGSAVRAWPELSRRLGDRIGDHDHAFATGPSDITGKVAAAVAAGATRIIAVGGDGTVNEALNGLVANGGSPPEAVTLGVIPLGTGRDFVRCLDIPGDPHKAIDRIAAGGERLIDIGRVTFRRDDGTPGSRLFANIASFGVSGEIDRKVNAASASRILPGPVSYYLATLGGLWRYRFQPVRITIDNHPPIETRIALVAVANGRYFGGGMMIAPDAEPDDGAFDVVILHCTSKWVLLKDLRLVYGGRHRDHDSITILTGRRLRAEPADGGEQPVLLDIDGEAPGGLPATFEVVPQALRVLC